MRATIPVLAAAAALGLPTLASAEVYNLLHRISTFTTTPEWEVRGTFSLPYAPISNTTGTNGSLESGNLINTLTSVQIESLLTAAQADDAAEKWYQIAIIPVASKIEEVRFETSVKLCHLRQSHSKLPTIDDEVSLTTRKITTNPVCSSSSCKDGSEVIITGLSYRILDITLDTHSCPIQTSFKIAKVLEDAKKKRQRQLSRRSNRGKKSVSPSSSLEVGLEFNTKFSLKQSGKVTKPTLKQALPTNEDGTVQIAPVEKSFLQKYWMYLIPVFILFIIPPGDDDRKEGAEAHASSDHVGIGKGMKKLN